MRKPFMLSVAMVISFLLGALQPAVADNRLNEGFTYTDPNFNCTYGRADLRHDTSNYNGFARVVSKILLDNPTTGKIVCGDFYARPGGYISAKIQYYKWNGSAWAFCAATSTYYNNTNNSTFDLTEGTHPKGSPICGNGSYAVENVGYVSVNGTWYGGAVRTQQGHNIPW